METWKAIQAALDSLTPAMAKMFITKLVKEENIQELKDKTKTLKDLEVHVSTGPKLNCHQTHFG